MKNFSDFKEYVRKNDSEISKTIQNKTDNFVEKFDAENLISYNNTYTQVAIMTMLEHYHDWLNSKS